MGMAVFRGRPSSFVRVSPTVVQRRLFWPDSMSSPAEHEKRFPEEKTFTDEEDPHMNGGYSYPPPVKTQFRDPYVDWWDPFERRNFGDPVHEDYDILGALAPWEYTFVSSTKMALFQLGCFVTAALGVAGIVYYNYPDMNSYPKEYEGGLERELGGPGAVRARKAGDPLDD